MKQPMEPHGRILCHPKDLAWMEAGMRGDLEEAALLRAIQRQLDALPQEAIPFPFEENLGVFAGINREAASSPDTCQDDMANVSDSACAAVPTDSFVLAPARARDHLEETQGDG